MKLPESNLVITRGKILYVEDEYHLRKNVAEILRDAGFEVIEASSGREGFAKFIEEKPEVILSDILMEDNSSGYEFLKKVRECEGENCNVPFVFITALGQKENIVKGFNMMVNDYLVKPIDFDLLIAKLGEKVNGARVAKKLSQENMKTVLTRISQSLPHEMQEEANFFVRFLGCLKKEPMGEIPKFYLDQLNKGYVRAMRFVSVVNNIFDGDALLKRLCTEEQPVNPKKFIYELLASDRKFRRVTYDEQNEEKIPWIIVNEFTLGNTIKCVVNEVLRISIRNQKVHLSLFQHYNGEFGFVIRGHIKSNNNKIVINDMIDVDFVYELMRQQGGRMELEFLNKNEVLVLLFLPACCVCNDSGKI